MTQHSYPDNSVQTLCSNWWIKQEKPRRDVWCLAEAHVRHLSGIPYVLESIGRDKDKAHSGNHSIAHFNLTTLKNTHSSPEITNLPIAAVPHYPGEVLTVLRAKRRPVLILANSGTAVEEHLRQNSSRSKFGPVYLVAPYYSAESNGIREGFKPEFVNRVRSLNYTQFFWDYLPHQRGHSSILRLDHIQPIEPDICSLVALPWKLSDEAQEVMKEAIQLHLCGSPPDKDGIWATAKQMLAEFPCS